MDEPPTCPRNPVGCEICKGDAMTCAVTQENERAYWGEEPCSTRAEHNIQRQAQADKRGDT